MKFLFSWPYPPVQRKMNRNLLISLLLLSLLPVRSFGQFKLFGSAVKTGDKCFQLTDESASISGNLWNTNQIDLNTSFVLQYELSFGNKDANGADGIAFVLHNDTATYLGNIGQGSMLGYGGIKPSLAVEFDTYQNGWDPVYDHISIQKNGVADHNDLSNSLAAPVPATPYSSNIEDSVCHKVRITWDATAKKMNVFFDCSLRLTYTGDIVTDIFSGNSEVFWGFTAATGGANNVQKVCIGYNSFSDLQAPDGKCAGMPVNFKFISDLCSSKYANSYLWNFGDPASLNADTSSVQNPTHIYKSAGQYNVSLTAHDSCSSDTMKYKVNISSVNLNLGNDTTLCPGASLKLDASNAGSSYLWSTGKTSKTISADTAGIYSLKVSNSDSCIAVDSLHLSFFSGMSSLSGLNTLPNIFTPNGDGINDELQISMAGESSFSIGIFDRWGTKLYDSTGKGEVLWDGTLNGKYASPGVYFYIVHLEGCSGEKTEKHGSFTVIR